MQNINFCQKFNFDEIDSNIKLEFSRQKWDNWELDFLNKNWDFATVCAARTLLCYELTLSRQNNVHESLVQVRRSASVNRHSDHISLFFYLYSRQQLSFIYWSTFWLLQIHYNTWCLIKETLVILWQVYASYQGCVTPLITMSIRCQGCVHRC